MPLLTPDSSPGAAALGSLRGTVRQLCLALAVLDDCVTTVTRDQSGRAALMQIELLAAVRHTVEVLEGTRRHFQSRELGDLRLELERLLRRWSGPAEDLRSSLPDSGR